MSSTTPPVLRLKGVSFVRDERVILAPLDWTVKAGERWLVLGANGSAKTTLLRIASLHEHPSTGTVEVLGERLGRTDVRELRRRNGKFGLETMCIGGGQGIAAIVENLN